MMHPETVAILQEQERSFPPKSPPPSDDDASTTADKRSFSQRLWRLVRGSLLATAHRKVRSASYCPPSAERPRSSKRRARSYGHAADGHDHQHTQHVHHHHRDGSACAATGAADAWRKSRMLQELEASTAGGCSDTMPITAVLRRCIQTSERDSHDALPGPRSTGWSRPAAQRTCRNCGQLFFARNVEPRVGAAFCSLDCKSSFEYLQCMQHLVDEHIDEEEAAEAEATFTATRAA